MHNLARALLAIALAAALQAAYSHPEDQVWLLDIRLEPLPPEVEENLYFRAGNASYTASEFKELLGKALVDSSNFTVVYKLNGVNWSVKHEVLNNSTIVLHLRKLGNVLFEFTALDTSYERRSDVLSLLSIASGGGIPGLNVFVQNANRTDFVLSPDRCKPDTYLPVADAGGALYSWRILAAYGYDIVLNESLTRIWDADARTSVSLALVKIPRELNLSWIAGECPGASVQATVTCGERVLTNDPPSTLVKAESEWFYPTTRNCTVRIAFAGAEKVCNASVLELERCKPEIHPVEVRVAGVEDGAGLVEIVIDGAPLDLRNPTACLWRGEHVLELRYDFGGTWVTLVEKRFKVEAYTLIPVRVNFSQIELSVRGCAHTPQVQVNGVGVPVERLERATGLVYATNPIPVIDANITVKACGAVFTFRARTENLTLAISLPEISLEFESPSPLPLIALLALTLAQMVLIAYALATVRRWSRCSTPAR